MDKLCALTFDDGPTNFTTQILNTLEMYKVVATFFVMGIKINEGKKIMKRAFDMGNEIANHSWFHNHMTEISGEAMKSELEDTSAAIKSITGEAPKIFRPPYGEADDTLKSVCAKLNLPLINWSVDPSDWESKNADSIYNIITTNMHDRAIILCHDMYDSTAEAIKRVVPELLRQGYKFVTVSDLARLSGFSFEPGVIYDNC